MRKAILVTRQWPAAPIERLRRDYDVTLAEGDAGLDPRALEEAMRNFDALCPTVCDRIDEAALSVPDARVSIIANFGAGLDHVDLAAARRAGIVVTNTPDVLTRSTAETALLLMLMAARRAGEGERQLRAGAWTGWRPTHLLGTSIQGKQLGLVGFGRIAQETARMAQSAFGMRIAYHARKNKQHVEPDILGATYFEHLDELVTQADIVSLHAPGGPETHHLLDARRLALMKPSAILINTARGSLVDEVALANALADHRIAAAGLDVYEHEPGVHAGLTGLENVVLLPHLGSATMETRIAMGMRVADNLAAFFAGEEPGDRVA